MRLTNQFRIANAPVINPSKLGSLVQLLKLIGEGLDEDIALDCIVCIHADDGLSGLRHHSGLVISKHNSAYNILESSVYGYSELVKCSE